MMHFFFLSFILDSCGGIRSVRLYLLDSDQQVWSISSFVTFLIHFLYIL